MITKVLSPCWQTAFGGQKIFKRRRLEPPSRLRRPIIFKTTTAKKNNWKGSFILKYVLATSETSSSNFTSIRWKSPSLSPKDGRNLYLTYGDLSRKAHTNFEESERLFQRVLVKFDEVVSDVAKTHLRMKEPFQLFFWR